VSDTDGHHISAQARRSELLHLTRERGRLLVAGIPTLMGVSAETVRRDLRLLEMKGQLRRAYGVAFPVENGAFESVLTDRPDISPEEKTRIARGVISHIGDAQTLFIDEGYQTQLIAQRLPEDRPLTVVTSSLPVALILAPRQNIQVLLLGGRVRGSTLGIVDSWAAEMLGRLRIDLAIIGANGISVESGITTPDPAVALVKGAAIKSSARRILIGAHHKFGTVTFVRFAEVADFEAVITGRELPASQANRFRLAGTVLHRV